MGEHALDRYAALTAVGEPALDDFAGGQFEIGVMMNNHRGISAEFERCMLLRS